MNTIAVIGGGASGLVSALYASNNKNNKIILIERNNICGKKLLVTGNGRCNYFNDYQDLSNYNSTNKELIDKLINKKNLKEVKELFNKLGIVPKIKNGYYYPFSNQAQTIKNALVNAINKDNIEVINNLVVDSIIKSNNKFIINNSIIVDKVIISTGSKSSPKTGSDGIGYKLLKDFNHTIIKPLPSLVQLRGKDKYFKDWSGIRTDVEISLYENNKYICSESGEIQLTSYGISGICVFNISGKVSRGLDLLNKEEVSINFLPFIKDNIIDFLNNLNYTNKTVSNLLEGILNYKLVSIIINKSSINKDKLFKDLSSKELDKLISNLTRFKVEITSTNSFDDSQVCTGGVSLTEVNLDTLESKLVKDLYIVGELLDIDGKCGGYNLTIAWISGILAGRSV